jgi:hypothetical protein
MSFRTRTNGSQAQVGKRFPVAEPYKNKLPTRISIAKRKKVVGTNHSAEVTDFRQPTDKSSGHIQAVLDGAPISAEVRLIQGNQNVAQWNPLKPVIYCEDAIPKEYLQSLSLHELVERTLDKELNMPWDKGGHILAEQIEKKAFLKSGYSEKDWDKYSRIVDTIHNNMVAAKPRKDGHIVFMSPNQFLCETMVTPISKKSWPSSTLRFLKKQMKNGNSGTPMFLDYTKSNSWHGGIDFDGRKRALAASQLGIRKIPVVIYGHREK